MWESGGRASSLYFSPNLVVLIKLHVSCKMTLLSFFIIVLIKIRFNVTSKWGARVLVRLPVRAIRLTEIDIVRYRLYTSQNFS